MRRPACGCTSGSAPSPAACATRCAGWRQLRRSPGFALAVAATFAPGIGADATMLGVVDRLLLRPPAHVRDPGQVYELGAAWRWQGMLVSASYFPPLGARPAPGRFFLPDEDALPDGVAVAACLVPSWR